MIESPAARLLREREEDFSKHSEDWRDGYRAALNDINQLHMDAFRFVAIPRRCF